MPILVAQEEGEEGGWGSGGEGGWEREALPTPGGEAGTQIAETSPGAQEQTGEGEPEEGATPSAPDIQVFVLFVTILVILGFAFFLLKKMRSAKHALATPESTPETELSF